MLLLIISIPFLHAFGFFGVSLPLLIGTLVLIYLFFSNCFRLMLHFSYIDWLLLGPLILGVVVLDYSNIQLLNLKHLALWLATIIIFYFGTKVIVVNSKFNLNDLGQAFLLALLIASLGVTIDFVAINFYGFYLSDVLPFQIGVMDVTKNFNGSLFRVRGFAAEPGFTAMVYELLLPLGLFYCTKNKTRFIFIPLILFSYSILTSAASLGALLVCLTFFSLASLKKISFAILTVISIGFLFSEQIFLYIDLNIGPKFLAWLAGDDLRPLLLKSFSQVLFDNPFGLGFGTMSYAFKNGGSFGYYSLLGGSPLNLYLEIALISGIAGLFSFLIFLGCIFYRSINVRNCSELMLLRFSLLWLLIHCMFVTEYYFPMLWVNLALIDAFRYVKVRSSNSTDGQFDKAKNDRVRST